jgi:hypothetical protein
VSSTPGASTYVVEIVKANLKKTKEDGQKWDTKIPFVGKNDDVMPDPFVQAYVNGYQSENPFMTTGNGSNTYYYEWRAKGQTTLKSSDKIHFMVWDKDKVDSDLMGECITDTIAKIPLGKDIVLRNCGQVDFIAFKITKK